MNRFALLAAAIVLVIIGWLVFVAGPVVEAPPPAKAPTVQTPPPAPDPVAPPPVEPAPVEPAPVAAADAGVEPDAEAEKGPFYVDLGRHSILLAERDGRFLELELRLHAATAGDQDAIRRRRKQLLRMMYFLVTRRTAEGMAQPGAKTRLIGDLEPRFGNAMRTGRIDRIEILDWQIVRKSMEAPKDAKAGAPTP